MVRIVFGHVRKALNLDAVLALTHSLLALACQNTIAPHDSFSRPKAADQPVTLIASMPPTSALFVCDKSKVSQLQRPDHTSRRGLRRAHVPELPVSIENLPYISRLMGYCCLSVYVRSEHWTAASSGFKLLLCRLCGYEPNIPLPSKEADLMLTTQTVPDHLKASACACHCEECTVGCV